MAITGKLLKRRFPQLLEKFDNNDLEALLGVLNRLDLEADQELRRYGDYADSLYLVWKGSLAQSMEIGGETIPLGVTGAGQHVGTVAIIDPGPALATVRTAEPGTLLCLDQTGLKTLKQKHPRAAGKLWRALSLELSEWLRVYEEYMSRRGGPQASGEGFVQRGRYLMGIRSE
ncbi:MAG: cyclic nucleotide-binding domain-containing protein [Pseudomonadota bacterium]|nr:cyclic nucleotide-binding domain-containing protein [Pseudomonadota bacterium]